jgi:hypothetical protein
MSADLTLARGHAFVVDVAARFATAFREPERNLGVVCAWRFHAQVTVVGVVDKAIALEGRTAQR